MKKTILYLSVALAILLQSCSSSNMFHKKRYGHLKWIDHETTVTENKKSIENNNPIGDVETKEKINDVILPVVNNEKDLNNNPVIDEPAKTNKKIDIYSNDKSFTNIADDESNSVQNNIVDPIQNNEITQPIANPVLSSPKMDDDVKLIVCVILALFIPPLAMYLWDQNTDMWFIIDLLLFLFWIFLFIGYPFGLGALAAVVIAFLRIFEML